MTTAREILAEAFGEIGVLDPAEPLSAGDAEFGLDKLNTMLDAWAADLSLSFKNTTTVFNLPGGTPSRTIGPAQQINIARPLRIEGQSFVRVGSIDYPLQIIDEATYNSIGIKSIAAPWPAYAWFDGGFPTGNLYFYPTGPAEVHLVTSDAPGTFATLDTDNGLPPGYKEAMVLGLAKRLQRPYSRPVDPMLGREASNALRRVKSLVVPQLAVSEPAISDRTRLLGIL